MPRQVFQIFITFSSVETNRQIASSPVTEHVQVPVKDVLKAVNICSVRGMFN